MKHVDRVVRRAWAAALWFQDLRTDHNTAFGDCREVLRVVLSFETWFMSDDWDQSWVSETQRRLRAIVEQPHRHMGSDPTLLPDLHECLIQRLCE